MTNETQTKALSPQEVEENLRQRASPLIEMLRVKINEKLEEGITWNHPVTVDIHYMVTGEIGHSMRMAPHPKFNEPQNDYAVKAVIKEYKRVGWKIDDEGDMTYCFRKEDKK